MPMSARRVGAAVVLLRGGCRALVAPRVASALRLLSSRSAAPETGIASLEDGSPGITLFGTRAIAEGAATPELTVFWLHGLGDTAQGWAGAFGGGAIEMPTANFKVVLPTAETKPVTLNGGYAMPSWFDIYGLAAEAEVDEDGILAAVADLDALVAREAEETAVVVAGFSQGGAVALSAGLRSPRVAAVVGASTWLPLAETYPAALADRAAPPPVALFHGDSDDVVQTAWGEETRDVLATLGFDPAWRTYPGMAHSACEAEFADVSAFLAASVPLLSPQ